MRNQSENLIKFIEKLSTHKEEMENERRFNTDKAFAASYGVSVARVKEHMGPPGEKEIFSIKVILDPVVVNRMRRGDDTGVPMSDMAIARHFKTSNQNIIAQCGNRKDTINPYSKFGRPAKECSAYVEVRVLNTESWGDQSKQEDEYWKGVGEIHEPMGPHNCISNFIGCFTMHPKMT